jgi:ferredoxin
MGEGDVTDAGTKAGRLIVTDDCHGCGVCVGGCPAGALSMVDGDVGPGASAGPVRARRWSGPPGQAPDVGPTLRVGPRARIDQARCDLCRKCLDTCPVEAVGLPYPPEWRE